MPNDIPQDPAEREKLVNSAHKRYLASRNYYRTWREKWVRFYKLYYKIRDSAEDEDEINTALPYAFGIIEQIVSKSVEPLFKLRPPFKVTAKVRGDEKSAENFSGVVASYFSNSEYQLDYTNYERECTITGSSWELDSQYQDYEPGKIWAKVPVDDKLQTIEGPTGREIQTDHEYKRDVLAEKDYLYPIKVGYATSFPSIFEVHPEPGKKKVKDMRWILHESKDVAIEDLQSQFYNDPSTGEKRPVYDLTELLKEVGDYVPGGIQPVNAWENEDEFSELEDARSGNSDSDGGKKSDDIDRVWLLDVYEKGQLFTIAQGKYVIRRVQGYLHKPRLPWRLKKYTDDPQFLYGIGAVEPVEDLLFELEDIHNLSMENWVRIINRMVAYHMDAVPFADDDFKPKAGGKIRVRSDVDVRQAIMTMDQPDVAVSMMQMEGNTKGLMEWANAVADLSPGPMGTKQTHKTLGGLIEIQNNLNTRFITLHRSRLSNYQDQMSSMEAFFAQYQFDPVPIRMVQTDGSTAVVEMNRNSIDTQGRGFDYVIEVDPSAGDDNVGRSLLMAAFDVGLKYEDWRIKLGGPEAPRADLSEVYGKILGKLGWADVGSVLKQPDGSQTPDQELEMMIQGLPVEPHPRENLIGHVMTHVQQRKAVAEAVSSGKVPPGVLRALDEHLSQTISLAQGILRDPVRAAQSQIAGST